MMTLTDFLEKAKEWRNGDPITVEDSAGFVELARALVGDAFATEEEAEALKADDGHAWPVIRDYVAGRLVRIRNLPLDMQKDAGVESIAEEYKDIGCLLRWL